MAWSAANLHCIENFNLLVDAVEKQRAGHGIAWVAHVQELRERFLECYGRRSDLDFSVTGVFDTDLAEAAHDCVKDLVIQLENARRIILKDDGLKLLMPYDPVTLEPVHPESRVGEGTSRNRQLSSTAVPKKSRGKNTPATAIWSPPSEQEDEESRPEIWHELNALAQTLDRLRRISLWMLIPVISSAVCEPSTKAAEARAVAEESVRSFLTQLRHVEDKNSRPSATVDKADEQFIARITEAQTHRILLLLRTMKAESSRGSGPSQSTLRPTIESFQSPVDRQRLLRDLQPYSCTYVDCQHPVTLFADVNSWAEHEKNVARASFYCPDCSDPTKPGFKSTFELAKHLKSSAKHNLEERDIRVILKFAQFSRPEDRSCCPFCWAPQNPPKLVEHMEDHFEKLAICASDDCKPLLEEEQASIGAFHQTEPMVPDETLQKRADELFRDIPIHKALSKYTGGIRLLVLDTNYKTRPGRWFRWGHVIKVTNAHETSTRKEANGSGATTEITDIVEGVSKTGEPMLVPARWFLIIKESRTECYCLRISTYGGRGVSKLQTGLYKKHHSPVYSNREPPPLLPEERLEAGEDPMQEAIAVESARDAQSLDCTARLLWTRVYKVSHNVEAALFGKVRPRWESKVEALFKNLNPHSALKVIRPDHIKIESSSLKRDSSRPMIKDAKRKKEPSVNLLQEDVDDLAEFDEKIVKPKYRPGDWVHFTTEGPKQTVIRCQVSEAHLSSGQWMYKLKDSGTGKQFQMETTSRTSPTGPHMICKEI